MGKALSQLELSEPTRGGVGGRELGDSTAFYGVGRTVRVANLTGRLLVRDGDDGAPAVYGFRPGLDPDPDRYEASPW